ncbi:MAG TPA: hypothetical protein VGC15_12870 [Acetobacteraceae bacterium]
MRRLDGKRQQKQAVWLMDFGGEAVASVDGDGGRCPPPRLPGSTPSLKRNSRQAAMADGVLQASGSFGWNPAVRPLSHNADKACDAIEKEICTAFRTVKPLMQIDVTMMETSKAYSKEIMPPRSVHKPGGGFDAALPKGPQASVLNVVPKIILPPRLHINSR